MLARLPRWTWLLVLPMLVGALLLMHGLEAQAGDSHHSAASAPARAADAHAYSESVPGDHGHCLECMVGHAMAACAAIISALGGVGLVRRLLARGDLAVPVAVVAARVRGLVGLARPPDPVWVRLSVMRC